MQKITNETIKVYDLGIEIDWNQNAIFQEHITEQNRRMRKITITAYIDPEKFDDLFTQIQQNYTVEHNQDMFIFNTFHGIGHYELELWNDRNVDPLVRRVENLENDKKVNAWAYPKFKEWKELTQGSQAET